MKLAVVLAFCLCVVGCLGEDKCKTGKNCIRNCDNSNDGNYQSCDSCHVFIQCSNRRTFVQPCPASLVWDDSLKRCVAVSGTCTDCDVVEPLSFMDKPGQCPIPSGPGLCIEACKTDYDCPGPLKCCFNGCGTTCGLQTSEEEGQLPPVPPVVETEFSLMSMIITQKRVVSVSADEDKPGECPEDPPQQCVDQCATDSQCSGADKCCYTGCGHMCLPPHNAVVPVETKPGTCPPMPRVCQNMCKVDEDCPGPLKCCGTGCGHICAVPTDEDMDDDFLTQYQLRAAQPQNQEHQDEVVEMMKIEPAKDPSNRHCTSTGSRCVSDCTGKKDGDYQSCHGCDVYVSCVGGLRYDDRPCAPGGLVWDDTKKRCEYNSSTCHGCLCPPPCKGTGPTCQRSCYGLPDGYYQSCFACNEFFLCKKGRKYTKTCTPYGTVWDDFKKLCLWWSDTCHPPRY